jgi:hypothetical protein
MLKAVFYRLESNILFEGSHLIAGSIPNLLYVDGKFVTEWFDAF